VQGSLYCIYNRLYYNISNFMKLSNILIILLLVGSIAPLFLLGEVSYEISKRKLFNLAIQDILSIYNSGLIVLLISTVFNKS